MTTPSNTLTRMRHRLEARARRLDDVLDRDPDNERAWTQYLETYVALKTGETDPMVTTKQMADAMGVSAETVRDMVKDGRLSPAAKFGNRGGYRFQARQKPTP